MDPWGTLLLMFLGEDLHELFEFDLLRSYACGIYSWTPLGHQLFPFHLYLQFDVAHNHSVGHFQC